MVSLTMTRKSPLSDYSVVGGVCHHPLSVSCTAHHLIRLSSALRISSLHTEFWMCPIGTPIHPPAIQLPWPALPLLVATILIDQYRDEILCYPCESIIEPDDKCLKNAELHEIFTLEVEVGRGRGMVRRELAMIRIHFPIRSRQYCTEEARFVLSGASHQIPHLGSPATWCRFRVRNCCSWWSNQHLCWEELTSVWWGEL